MRSSSPAGSVAASTSRARPRRSRMAASSARSRRRTPRRGRRRQPRLRITRRRSVSFCTPSSMAIAGARPTRSSRGSPNGSIRCSTASRTRPRKRYGGACPRGRPCSCRPGRSCPRPALPCMTAPPSSANELQALAGADRSRLGSAARRGARRGERRNENPRVLTAPRARRRGKTRDPSHQATHAGQLPRARLKQGSCPARP